MDVEFPSRAWVGCVSNFSLSLSGVVSVRTSTGTNADNACKENRLVISFRIIRVRGFPLLSHPTGREFRGRRIKLALHPYDLISKSYRLILLGETAEFVT